MQAASRALTPPGDAQEDWQIFVNLGLALGATLDYTSSAHVRADVGAGMASERRLRRPRERVVRAAGGGEDWLQASNPSERWKWDVMFQDLPPVKFEGRPEPSSIPVAISLQKID